MLKKKITVILLMVCAVPLLSPAMPKAQAAFLEDRLAEINAGGLNVAQIQQLIKIKDSLEQGNKEALWETITKAAALRTGQADTVNTLATVASQLAGQEQSTVKDNVTKAVESAIRSKVQQEVTHRLVGYQDEFALLSALLNNGNSLTPKAVESNNSLAGTPQSYSRMLDMTATAYAPGPLDNGKWNELTYVGSTIKKGIVAVDPDVIPMGTRLWVEGYGEGIAEDQGQAIKGDRLDLAFDTRQEALDYGIQKVKVYLLD